MNLLIAWVLLLAGAAVAHAKPTIDVLVGWDDKFRPGRWTPLYVTLADKSPRQVVLEIYAPTDRRYAMRIRQGLAIGPTPVTVPIFVPLSYQLNETVISVHDADSYRRLESTILSETPAYQGARGGPQSVGANQFFVGISGEQGGERLIESQFAQQNIVTSYLATRLLPASIVGYDMLDVLILNRPKFSGLALEQQQAIADWVRSGGILILWPGPEPPPPNGPLIDILPATIRDNRKYEIDPAAIDRAGLARRFQNLTGRDLADLTTDAKPVPLLGSSTPGYRRWVGFGQVVLLPIDISTLMFDGDKGVDFWRAMLKDVIAIPVHDTSNQGGYPYGMADPYRGVALRQTMDWISEIPGAGRFGFSYLAGVLLAMMVVVGPVDWFVLKRLGRQPWTWITITGWIALVTLGAIYIGHIFKSGDVYFRSASLIDEAHGARIAALDIAGIYSPQTTRYDLRLEPESWWRPASEVNPYGASGLQLELNFHQDYRGNRPTPMVINVWNMRFIEGSDATPAPPMIETRLARKGGRIEGEIRNRSDVPLSDLRIRAGDRMTNHLGVTIEPGQSRHVSLELTDDRSLVTTRPADHDPWNYRYQQMPTSQPSAMTMNGIAERRSQRIDQVLIDRSDLACVYAEFESTAAPARLKLNVDHPRSAHRGVVRALVPLE